MGRERVKEGRRKNKKKKVQLTSNENARERSLKEELVKLTTSVRNKYKALKRDTDDMQRYFEASAKPIVVPLQKTVAESVKEAFIPPPPHPIKVERKHVKKEEKDEMEEEEGEEDEVNKTFNTSTQTEDSAQYYLNKITTGDVELDKTYGVRPDGKGGTLIGDSKITFAKNKIYVGQKVYDASDGLLELLFMQVPNKSLLDDRDLRNYKDILLRTNAHRQMYSADKPLNANRGKKYKSVISILFSPLTSASSYKSPKVSGKGITAANSVNGKVNRLRILILSQQAGHTAHDSEIERIIHSLRINNVIQ